MDDEKIAYPMLERARKLGVKRVCLHKGLPLGPVADYNHPRDIIKAARDFPDIDFILYHAGLLTVPRTASADMPWTTEFCRMAKKEAGLKNIYMELGSHLRPARHHHHPATHPYQRWLGSAPSSRYAIFIRVR